MDVRRGSLGSFGFPSSVIDGHVLLAGKQGSGKTSSIIAPWIAAGVAAGYSVITVDVKGDLMDQVRANGLPTGARISEIDYRKPETSARWNWLAELDSDRAIDNACASIIGRTAPPGTDKHFFDQDNRCLRGLLESLRESRLKTPTSTSTLMRTLADQESVRRIVARDPRSPAATRLRDLADLYPEDYSKRVSGVLAKLDAISSPSIEAVSRRPTFKTSDVLSSPQVVSVVAPMHDGPMSVTFSSLFIKQVLHKAFDRFSIESCPVLLVLDEAARLSDRIDYDELLSVARGASVAVVLAVQDLAHFKNDNERSSIVSNAGTLIVMENSSPLTARHMSDRLGHHSVPSVTRTRSAGRSPATSSATYASVPVLGQREIMSPPIDGRIAVIHSWAVSDQPFLVDLQR
ncbi:hypothetical protein DBR22_04415 [Arthrobacter sp. HMWF013]|nr:hypothetical protein DBR22_04415 [Arthrobacter sp. HMWF013]